MRTPAADAPLSRIVDAFCNAVAAGEAHVALAVTRADRWEAHGPCPSALVRAARLDPPTVAQGAIEVEGDRAIVDLFLTRPDAAASSPVLALEHSDDAGWQVVGVVESRRIARLFVSGTTEVPVGWDDLLPDLAVSHWGRALAAAMARGDREAPPGADSDAWTRLTATVPGTRVVVRGALALPQLHRAALEVRLIGTDGAPAAVRHAVLERDEARAPWRLRSVAETRSIEALLDGVGDPEPQPRLTPDELRAVVPELFGEAIEAALHQALTGRLDPDSPIDLARERAIRAVPEPPDDDIEARVRRAFLAATTDADEPDATRELGPEEMGSLFAAMARSLVPEDLDFDLDVPTGRTDGDTPETVHVEVNLGDLLGGLFRHIADAASRQAEPRDDGDEV